MYEVNQEGGSCIDPVFYHFADDETVYHNISSTFIFANAIKVSPVLEALGADAKTFQAYFPKGAWASLTDFGAIVNSQGEWVDLPADHHLVQAHLMPGALTAYQNITTSNGAHVNTTHDLLKQSVSIVVNRDESGKAEGTLFLDDGISRTEISDKEFEYYNIIH